KVVEPFDDAVYFRVMVNRWHGTLASQTLAAGRSRGNHHRIRLCPKTGANLHNLQTNNFQYKHLV
ncbi:MAG: hypothetical protein ACWGNK_03575, partial [Desulfobacterales bacterium]